MLCWPSRPRLAGGSKISGSPVSRLLPRSPIAKDLGERHVRLLAPLAFVASRIVAAIADCTAPADLTVTGLAKTLPHSWTAQQERFARPFRLIT